MSAGGNIANMAERLVTLKQEFARTYDGNSHIQEILPEKPTGNLPIDGSHLLHLHEFARHNPIYHNTQSIKVSGVQCTAYEGDINSYWLNSIKHGSSCQPFYPTWILSAYIAALNAKSLGCRKIVDIGSGDGRIAYCGKVLGLEAHSIEIDDTLAELQAGIVESTGMSFEYACADATTFDYDVIGNEPVAFFIGGLPQMGGDILADSVLGKVLKKNARYRAIFVLAGSHSRRQLAGSTRNGGWDALIDRYGLCVRDTVSLPTVWTFDQAAETPYIFVGLA